MMLPIEFLTKWIKLRFLIPLIEYLSCILLLKNLFLQERALEYQLKFKKTSRKCDAQERKIDHKKMEITTFIVNLRKYLWFICKV
jgi:hypothetical protein